MEHEANLKFPIVVVSLISDLWLGLGIKPEVYDNRSKVKTKAGYILFVVLAVLITISTVVWAIL
ncbi:hypothetical protein DCC85_02925 [Paenibacillus sp. CAA11]|nr:hypothetical protein DCC85_02925 [Paenibacillus sp. CAA11]